MDKRQRRRGNRAKPATGPREPIIGIVPGLVPCESVLRVTSQYEDAIAMAGGAPIMLPLLADVRAYQSILPLVDGFVLSGGADLDPAQYGGDVNNDKLEELTPQRDVVERLILAYAYMNDIPVLGICRGFQMINVFFGGTLHIDLGDRYLHDTRTLPQVNHRQADNYDHPTHEVDLVPGSRLGTLLGTSHLAVNSMHHQGVDRLAPILRATARCTDGLIEGVEAKNRTFIAGVQWHPEYFPRKDQMGGLFAGLVREAGRAHTDPGRAGAPLTIQSMDRTMGCLNMELDLLASAAL